MKQKNQTELLYAELRRRAEQSLEHLYEEWRNLHRIRPVAATWVSENVLDDQGRPLDDFVLCLLPEEHGQHHKILSNMVLRTKACALLLIRQLGDQVKVIYETPIGTTSWTYPIEDRIGAKVLGRRVVATNVDSVGILWSPDRGQA